MHEVLVNRLGGLSLPRKSVVRLTDRPDMTLDVYRGRKTTKQKQNNNSPSADSRGAVFSYWRKYVHEVLVNRLGGLSLPRKSVVRLTVRPDMTLDVHRGRKTTTNQKGQNFTLILCNSRARAYCACSWCGWGRLDIFFVTNHFSLLSPPLSETARYRLKYSLKGPLSPQQPTHAVHHNRTHYYVNVMIRNGYRCIPYPVPNKKWELKENENNILSKRRKAKRKMVISFRAHSHEVK